MNNKKVGDFISELRKEKNLTQKELASKLYITDKAVSKWERGVSLPDITLLKKISNVLGASVLEILNGERFTNTTIDYTNINENVEKISRKVKKSRKKAKIVTAILIVLVLGIVFSFMVWADKTATNYYNDGTIFMFNKKTKETESGTITTHYGLGYKRIEYNLINGNKYNAFGSIFMKPKNHTITEEEKDRIVNYIYEDENQFMKDDYKTFISLDVFAIEEYENYKYVFMYGYFPRTIWHNDKVLVNGMELRYYKIALENEEIDVMPLNLIDAGNSFDSRGNKYLPNYIFNFMVNSHANERTSSTKMWWDVTEQIEKHYNVTLIKRGS